MLASAVAPIAMSFAVFIFRFRFVRLLAHAFRALPCRSISNALFLRACGFLVGGVWESGRLDGAAITGDVDGRHADAVRGQEGCTQKTKRV